MEAAPFSRAAAGLNSMLQAFDEVVYVDWNTEPGKKSLRMSWNYENRHRLRTIQVTPADVEEIMGDKPASHV